MYRKVVADLKKGISPLLFTGIGADNLGSTAMLDDARCGDLSLIPNSLLQDTFPYEAGDVLIERITTAPHLILCGGGHVAVQTALVAKRCGFSVTVIDERGDFANRDRFPDADKIVVDPFDVALDRIDVSNAFYVIVTRGHRDDRLCLERILHKPFTYCGMIGSRTKVGLVFDNLKAQGFPSETIARIHAPIGLHIGAITPEEIAVSIVGEMISVKNKLACGTAWDEALCRAIETLHEPYALVTLIAKKGSAPRSTGARMIVRQDGTIISSIGGGFGEYQAARYALAMFKDRSRAKRYTCQMNNTDAAEAGMVCGGSVDVLIQIIEET